MNVGIFSFAGARALLKERGRSESGRSGVLAYLVALGAWVLVRELQTQYLGLGYGFDVGLYASYAQSWGGGAAPYVDFSPEYPPGAMLVFLAPYLVSGAAKYREAFAAEMAVFDLAACLFVVAWARRSRPPSSVFWLWPTACYLMLSTALYPVLYTRFDMVPAALVIAAAYFSYGPRFRLGAALLGVAAAVKLWPLALAPLFLGLALRRGGWRRVLITGMWLGLGIFLATMPFLERAGTRVASFLRYHQARGIEVGTTWATAALLLNLAHWIPARSEHEYGAYHIKGQAAAWFVSISPYTLVLAALVPQLVAFFFGGLGRAEDAHGEVGLKATCATALGFMIGGKVLSPQFAIWLAPLLPLTATNPLAALAAVASAVLTTVQYPFTAAALEMVEPGHARALAFTALRNALFIALYVWHVYWLYSRRRARITASASPQLQAS